MERNPFKFGYFSRQCLYFNKKINLKQQEDWRKKNKWLKRNEKNIWGLQRLIPLYTCCHPTHTSYSCWICKFTIQSWSFHLICIKVLLLLWLLSKEYKFHFSSLFTHPLPFLLSLESDFITMLSHYTPFLIVLLLPNSYTHLQNFPGCFVFQEKQERKKFEKLNREN